MNGCHVSSEKFPLGFATAPARNSKLV